MESDEESLGDRKEKLTEQAELESLKRFKHVQPRIDPDYYQAEIQDMITAENEPEEHNFEDLCRQAKIDWFKGTRSTSTKKHEKEINEFLVLTRNIFEPFRFAEELSWNQANVAVPLESDLKAIEYLSEHNWDVEAACFHFCTDMGLGKELVFIKKLQEQVVRQPTAALFSEMKDKIFKTGAENRFYGAFENTAGLTSIATVASPAPPSSSNGQETQEKESNGAGSSKDASTSSSVSSKANEKSKAAAVQKTYYNFPFPREYVISKDSGKTGKFTVDGTFVAPDDDGENKESAGRGQAKDKAETKRRWGQIFDKGAAMLKQVGDGLNPISYSSSAKKDPRASVHDVQALMDEAATLGPLLDSPGDSFAEEVRVLLSDLLKQLLACRQWSASVRDMMENSAVHHGPRVDHAATDTTDLKGLLQASDALIFRPPEVKRLKSLCLSLEKVQSAAKKFIVPIPPKVEVPQEGEEETSKKGRKKNVSKKKAEAEQEKEQGPPKPHLEELNKLLLQARPLPLKLPCVVEYEKLYDEAIALVEEVDRVYEKSETYRVRDKMRHLSAMKKPTLQEMRNLRERVERFPLAFNGTYEKIDNIIWEAEEWKEEVMLMANDSSKGSRSTKQSGVSIKRVEALLHEGERLHFDFTAELDILRQRQIQAKEWLDRLKNSFKSKSKGSLRGRGTSGEVRGQVKMGLADMKMMVEEGSALLDDEEAGKTSSSRELNKAQSAVDIAEEWLARVKEVLAAGIAGGDLTDLKDLIRESDEMPVYMEEAVVMKSHLNAMEWAKKAAKIMYVQDNTAKDDEDEDGSSEDDEDDVNGDDNGDKVGETEEAGGEGAAAKKEKKKRKPKTSYQDRPRVFARPRLAEIQKLSKEIHKIRDQVPSDVSEELELPKLREEEDCLMIMQKADEWAASVKRITASGAIRKGTKLEKVVRFYEEGKNFMLNFDFELRPFRSAILNAERWLKSNDHVLKLLKIDIGTKCIIEESNEDATTNSDDRMDLDDSAAYEEEADTDLVPYSVLQRIAVTADSLSVTFPEAEMAIERLEMTDLWITRVNRICNKGKQEQSQLLAGVGRGKPPAQEKRKPAAMNTGDLQALLMEADTLHVNLGKEKKLIKDTMLASDRWNVASEPLLKQVLQNSVGKLSTTCVDTANKDVANISSAFQQQTDIDLKSLDLEEDLEDNALLTLVTQFVKKSKAKRIAAASQANAAAAQAAAAARAAAVPLSQRVHIKVAGISMGAPIIIPTRHAGQFMQPMETKFMDSHLKDVNATMGSLAALQKDGQRIGISSRLTVQVDLCVAALEWVRDAMAVLAPPKDGKFSTEKDKTWGDSSQQSIMALMDDTKGFISEEVRQGISNRLQGTALSGVSNSAKEIKELFESSKGDSSSDEGRAFERLQFITESKGKRSLAKPKKDALPPKKEEAKVEPKTEEQDGDEGGQESMERRPSRTRVRSSKLSEDPRGKRGLNSAEKAPKADEVDKDESVKMEVDDDEDAQKDEEEEKEEEEVLDMTRKFAPFKKLVSQGLIALPPQIQEVVEFWVRCLGGLLFRIYEVDVWSTAAKRTLDRSTGAAVGSPQKRCFEDVLYLLKYSELKGLDGASRQRIEDEVTKFNDWVEKANRMRRRERGRLLMVDDLKVFCKTGEQLMFDVPVVGEMRAELKKAKSWIARLHATGIEKGTALSSDLLELLPEAETICCNLSTYCSTIHATTKSYCLCRQAYFGLMIGCDHCDDWFHAPCMGIGKLEAETVDKYTCFRCQIERSFSAACTTAAGLANKWCDVAEFNKRRRADKERLIKSKSAIDSQIKKLAEVHYLRQEAMRNGQPDPIVPKVLPNTPVGLDRDEILGEAIPIAISGGLKNTHNREPVLSPHDMTFEQLTAELNGARDKLAAVMDEEKRYYENEAKEQEHKTNIINWMKDIQRVIWPSNHEGARSGAPIGSRLAHPPFDYMEGSAMSSEKLTVAVDNLSDTPLLPTHLCNLANKAITDGFDHSDDVLNVVEAFRWMSWCSLFLTTIRAPPTTHIMRMMLKTGTGMVFADKSILSGLQATLNKAISWKQRASRFLRTNPERLELSTANDLLIEGNMIPFSSRVKLVLQSTVKNGQTLLPPEKIVDGQAVEGAAEEGAPPPKPSGKGRGRGGDKRGGKRGPRKQEAADVAQLPLFVSRTADFPDSSDDEAEDKDILTDTAGDEPKLTGGDGGEEEEENARSLDIINEYALWSTHVMTDYKELWPVKLTVSPLNLIGEGTGKRQAESLYGGANKKFKL